MYDICSARQCDYRNKLPRGAALVAKSCGSAAGGDDTDVNVALGLPLFSLPEPQLSPVMVLPAVASWDSTRQGQVLLLPCNWGRICPVMVSASEFPSHVPPTEAVIDFTVTRAMPGDRAVCQELPSPAGRPPHRPARGGLGTLWGVFLCWGFTESMTSVLLQLVLQSVMSSWDHEGKGGV